MPNGHPQELERIRQASRFWSVVWQVGDFVYYLGFLTALGLPGGLAAGGMLRNISFWSACLLLGKVVLALAIVIPLCMLASLGIKKWSWRMAGLHGK